MYAVRLQEMMQSMMDGLYSKDVGGVDQNDIQKMLVELIRMMMGRQSVNRKRKPPTERSM